MLMQNTIDFTKYIYVRNLQSTFMFRNLQTIFMLETTVYSSRNATAATPDI